MKNQKDTINALIKRLEKIRNTDEINEVEVIPYEEVDSFKMIDGKTYVTLQMTINIRYEKLFEKGDIFDNFAYKIVD